MALLVARLEDLADSAKDHDLHAPLTRTKESALDLFDKFRLLEVSLANAEHRDEELAKLDERFDRSLDAIRAMHGEVSEDALKRLADAGPESTGSDIGDAVRDSFLNMGAPMTAREVDP
ncbi:MAG: hypothetical protein KAI24_21135 [Planctomycetes bacterium]|nr:hypothetical protein [Planctomycetota bacterium]